jgi:hypothetical protein
MSALFLELEHWIMQTRQFSNLKHLVESDPMATKDRGAAAQPATAGAALG